MRDPREIVAMLRRGVMPLEAELIDVADTVREVFVREPNLLELDAPLVVVGDLHGQLYDLYEILQLAGEPPGAQYLFLGDYVDRGQHSLETITLLFCMKLLHPGRVHLLRGNHEDAKICSNYGFLNEIFQKCALRAREYWRSAMDTFEMLPLAALVRAGAFRLFAVHAGLSPALHAVQQINAIPRWCDFPENQQCVFADLLWSDPIAAAPAEQVVVFEKSTRGAGCGFGMLPVLKFCHQNDVQHILRSHQMQNDGYMTMFRDLLSTVWSAPRYTGKLNLASVCCLHENGQRDYLVFECGVDFDARERGLPGFTGFSRMNAGF